MVKLAASADRRFRSASRRARSYGVSPYSRDSSRRRSGPSVGSCGISDRASTGSSAGPKVISAAIEGVPVPEQTIQRRPIMTRILMIVDSIARLRCYSIQGFPNEHMRLGRQSSAYVISREQDELLGPEARAVHDVGSLRHDLLSSYSRK